MSDGHPGSHSVLVPAVYAPHAVTCLRSLGRRDIHTIAAFERQTPAFRSRYCDERIVVPSPETDVAEYKNALLSIARRDEVHAAIPMREVDAYVLAKYRSAFATEVTPLWPSLETIETAHDRLRLTEVARKTGVPTPETERLDDVDDWSPKQIVKPRYALLADDYLDHTPQKTVEPTGLRYLDVATEPDRESIRTEMGHVPIVQEYVPGEEYAYWALYEDGKPVATCQKHQVRAFSHAGGTSIFRETVRNPELESVGHALLDELDWHGFASVQFKKDARTGEFTLLEINPRLWVSVACPVLAGIDFPHEYWRLANGESVAPTADYELGVGTHRLGGEVMYLLSVLRDDETFIEAPPFHAALTEVVRSLFEQPYFDYLTRDDPRPFVREITNWSHRQAAEYSIAHVLPDRYRSIL